MQLKKALIAVVIFVLIGYVAINHARFWGGVLSDKMTHDQQDQAAATFDFDYYYGYDAALSDLIRIFDDRDETFIDKILTRQEAYKNLKFGPKPIDKEDCTEKDHCISYLYRFHHLYLFGHFIYSTGDSLDIRFKQGQFDSLALIHLDDLGSYVIKKKAKNLD